MAKFEIGEIIIGQNFVSSPECNGMEGEIVGELKLRRNWTGAISNVSEAYRYRVKWADGDTTGQEPHFLRKKKPPEEDINWVEKLKLKNWEPNKVTEEVG